MFTNQYFIDKFKKTYVEKGNDIMEENIKNLIASQTRLAEQVLDMAKDIKHMKEEIICLTNQNNDLKKKIKELENKKTNVSASEASFNDVFDFMNSFFKTMDEARAARKK